MARIELLRNPAAAFGCDLVEGETGDVDASLAETLIARGIARAVEPKTLKGVSEEPAIAGDKSAMPEPNTMPISAPATRPAETESTTAKQSKKKAKS